MFDDAQHVARRGLTQDPAVAGRVGHVRCQDRDGVTVVVVHGHERLESFGVEQRNITGKNDEGAFDSSGDRLSVGHSFENRGGLGRGVKDAQGALDRASRPRHLILVDDESLGGACESLAGHAIAIMANDDGGAEGLKTLGRRECVAKNAAPRQGMQNLGGGRTHTRSGSCG